jgi:hypothetical protein
MNTAKLEAATSNSVANARLLLRSIQNQVDSDCYIGSGPLSSAQLFNAAADAHELFSLLLHAASGRAVLEQRASFQDARSENVGEVGSKE